MTAYNLRRRWRGMDIGTMGKSESVVDKDRSVLLLTDIQPDFMPGGALAVEGGDQIVPLVRHLMERDLFGLYVATQDWHPADHVSFASNHPGREPMTNMQLYGHPQELWPDHCVQGTLGAEIDPGLSLNQVSAIVRKGNNPKSDSYSAFRNNWSPEGERRPTGLAGYLRDRGIQDVYICGLTTDFCVKWSAQDAADAGFRVWVIWDLTRPVNPDSLDQVRQDLERQGIQIVASQELTVVNGQLSAG